MSRRRRASTAVLATSAATLAATLAVSAAHSSTTATTIATMPAGTSVQVVAQVRSPVPVHAPVPAVHVARGTYFRTATLVSTPPPVKARAWAVADMDTGRILAAHRRHAQLLQASTIKLLTALTAADTVAVLPTHRITRAEAHPQYCTCAGLVVGRRYTRIALMAGMLLPSGNDAAEALAGSHPLGRAAFVAAMNAKATALGAKHTRVVTPSGLTAPGAHSTAYDLLVFLRAAQANPVVEPILALPSFQLGPRGGRTHTVYRRTDYVNKYPTAQGKSGYTTPAKHTLVVDTPVGVHHIGVATLGAPRGRQSTSGARALTLWAAANFSQLRAIGQLPPVPATPAAPVSTTPVTTTP